MLIPYLGKVPWLIKCSKVKMFKFIAPTEGLTIPLCVYFLTRPFINYVITGSTFGDNRLLFTV